MIKKILLFFYLIIIEKNCVAQRYNLLLDTTSLVYSHGISNDTIGLTISYSINSSGDFLTDSTVMFEEFYPNGQRKCFYGVLNNNVLNGTYLKWHSNGKMESVINYLYGLPYGGFTEWHENGKLKISGNYWAWIKVSNINKVDSAVIGTKKQKIKYINRKIEIEGRVSTNFGEFKDGEWLYYDNNGKIIKKENWSKGILKKTSKYSE